MALSKEWTDWHLTLNGWVSGSRKTDFADTTRNEDAPADRVLTVRFSEHISSMYSKPDREHTIVWSSDDDELIEKLKNEYGEPPSLI